MDVVDSLKAGKGFETQVDRHQADRSRRGIVRSLAPAPARPDFQRLRWPGRPACRWSRYCRTVPRSWGRTRPARACSRNRDTPVRNHKGIRRLCDGRRRDHDCLPDNGDGRWDCQEDEAGNCQLKQKAGCRQNCGALTVWLVRSAQDPIHELRVSRGWQRRRGLKSHHCQRGRKSRRALRRAGRKRESRTLQTSTISRPDFS
jgi:hypothetical protein